MTPEQIAQKFTLSNADVQKAVADAQAAAGGPLSLEDEKRAIADAARNKDLMTPDECAEFKTVEDSDLKPILDTIKNAGTLKTPKDAILDAVVTEYIQLAVEDSAGNPEASPYQLFQDYLRDLGTLGERRKLKVKILKLDQEISPNKDDTPEEPLVKNDPPPPNEQANQQETAPVEPKPDVQELPAEPADGGKAKKPRKSAPKKADLKAALDEQATKMQAAFQQERAKMQADFNQQLEAAKTGFEAKQKALIDDFDAQKEKIVADCENEIAKIKAATSSANQADADAATQQALENAKQEIAELKTSYGQQIRELQSTQEAQKKELTEANEAKIQELQASFATQLQELQAQLGTAASEKQTLEEQLRAAQSENEALKNQEHHEESAPNGDDEGDDDDILRRTGHIIEPADPNDTPREERAIHEDGPHDTGDGGPAHAEYTKPERMGADTTAMDEWNQAVVTRFGFPFINFACRDITNLLNGDDVARKRAYTNIKDQLRQLAHLQTRGILGGMWDSMMESPIMLLKTLKSSSYSKCYLNTLIANGREVRDTPDGANLTVRPTIYGDVKFRVRKPEEIPINFVNKFFVEVDPYRQLGVYRKWTGNPNGTTPGAYLDDNAIPYTSVLAPTAKTSFSRSDLSTGSFLSRVTGFRKANSMVTCSIDGHRGGFIIPAHIADVLFAY